MPETRYIEVYKDGKVVERIPETISDEQLQFEELLKRVDAILKKPKAQWTTSDIKDLLEYLVKYR